MILTKGVVRSGRIELAEPINLPDGSEVLITTSANGKLADLADSDRPMTAAEITDTLAAMEKVEPFDWTDEDRASADAWDRKVNDYTIANLDRGLEDLFR